MRKTGLLLLFGWVTWLSGQGTWIYSGRNHPELHWRTLRSSHFRIHYHQGLDSIAVRGAAIAEQIRPVLLKQVDQADLPVVDITFTSEDEIMNGYALWTNSIFIWVDQNDAALWLEDEKWLEQVVAHELQHVVLFNALKSVWLPEPWNYLLSGTPGWFVEGLAEYMTEKWRPYRADLSHKVHVLSDKTADMDPHHDGFSKLLYLADRFGDSTLVNIIHYRNKAKIADFEKGFKKYTGLTLERFEEDWRRHMNTYYYGFRAQKEALEEVGTVTSLPVTSAAAVLFSPDSFHLAVIGKKDDQQLDQSLLILTRDTTRPKPSILTTWFRRKKKTKQSRKKPVKWTSREIDYGRFHSQMSWTPDGSRLAYAKYHYGPHQSLVWDIRIADLRAKKPRLQWVTHSGRCQYPDWSPDGKSLIYVRHERDRSNLMQWDSHTDSVRPLTSFRNETQLLTPRWSPNGQAIALSVAGPDGNLDLYLADPVSGDLRRLTTNPGADYGPVWHPDGRRITYTSHRKEAGVDAAPNLYTLDVKTGEIRQNTDVGDALWSNQWTPRDSTVLALSLPVQDTLQVVAVDPARRATTQPLTLRPYFARWQSHRPPDTLDLHFHPPLTVSYSTGPYQFYRHLKHLASFLFPGLPSVFGFTAWTDAMGRHILEGVGGADVTGKTRPWAILSYLNQASYLPWSFTYTSNSQFTFRYYDRSRSGLIEQVDGLDLAAYWVFNRGESLSSQHWLRLKSGWYRRRVVTVSDSIDAATGEYIPRRPAQYHDLPVPIGGTLGLTTLSYQWLDRRPSLRNQYLPTQGGGLLTSVDVADRSYYGDFTFTRWNLDAFVNVPVGDGPALYARIVAKAMSGTPAPQDSLALTRDPNLYFPYGAGDLGVLFLPENYNPRGWNGVRLGDRLVFSSLEFRAPLVQTLPINLLGLTLGSCTGALVMEVANAWTHGGTPPAWVTTAGYEVKIGLQAGNTPIVFVALGQAQELDGWNRGDPPRFYARLALINPF
ncbi:MAG: hypothetical protein D6762_02080 [Candidatus Neomarinimicrobiota bacterium]|nr:MAG: hypothetical protein D6762_02080 [Candidatus Neomarinimicrobiota bacterium]